METAADLILEKRSKVCEIVVVLFEYCNFSCTFCPQNHNSKLGMTYNEIVSKADYIIDYINNNKFASGFVVRFFGGEPFADEVLEQPEILQAYRDVTSKIRTGTNIGDRSLNFVWITNFSMKKHRNKVLNFIEDQKRDTRFIVSFDFKGRFNKSNREIFQENIEIYKDYIENISTVLTKQNIEAAMEGDEYFEYLYSNFEYSWDKYVKGSSVSDYLTPSESLLLKFYKFLVDKYSEGDEVRDHLIMPFIDGAFSKKSNPASCSRGNGYAIDADNSIISEGCVGTHYLKRNRNKVLKVEEKVFLNNTIENFLEKYNCHACEYYQQCPMTCFVSLKTDSVVEDMDVCINKLLFKYLDSKK